MVVCSPKLKFSTACAPLLKLLLVLVALNALYVLLVLLNPSVTSWCHVNTNGTSTVTTPQTKYLPHRCLVSFCLYGRGQMYTLGALRNIEDIRYMYPGWRVRVYLDNSVPRNVTAALIAAGAENQTSQEDLRGISGSLWRFLAADDDDIDVFISRDTDSRVSVREKCAVEEWLQSSKILHSMRDHPRHQNPILAGMFGLKTKEFFAMYPKHSMRQLMINWKNHKGWKKDDELFLKEQLWPMLNNSVMVHDSYHCHNSPYGPGLSFPCPRKFGEYVGQKVNAPHDQPQTIIPRREVPVECRRQPHYIYG